MALFALLTVAVALFFGLYRKPLTQREKERGATVGQAIRNTVAVQFGESVAGQNSWEFGPPPPLATMEPEGRNIVMMEEVAPPPPEVCVPTDTAPCPSDPPPSATSGE